MRGQYALRNNLVIQATVVTLEPTVKRHPFSFSPRSQIATKFS